MVRVRVAPLAALLVVGLVLTVPTASAGGDHPDVGFSPSFALFPGPDEVQTALDDHADHPWVTLHELGTSGEERPIRMAEITNPDSTVPMQDRVVTFIFTQQHGNEPAGTPAALELLTAITNGGAVADTLDNQILLLLPMANPDGAAANTRANAGGTDINRDHIALETHETNIIHQVLNTWDVHIAMDHHEYGGTGLGNPVPVRVYDYDLTTLFPRHGNVRAPTLEMAQDLMYDGIWPPAEEAGYSANEYGERTINGEPYDQVAGGPDPGIMRNHLGLHNIAGLLVETRVDAIDNPFHDAERRTAIHLNVMESTLRYGSERAADFIRAKAESEALNRDDPMTEYLEGDNTASIPAAWRVPIPDGSDDLMMRHGFPAPLVEGEHHVYPHAVPEGPHMQAVMNPESSRHVFDADAYDSFEIPAAPTPRSEPEEAPTVGILAVLAAVAAALVATRRRA